MSSDKWRKQVYSINSFKGKFRTVYLGQVVDQISDLFDRSSSVFLHTLTSAFQPARAIPCEALDEMMIEVEKKIGTERIQKAATQPHTLLDVELIDITEDVVDHFLDDKKNIYVDLIITRHRVMDDSETPISYKKGNMRSIKRGQGLYITCYQFGDLSIKCCTNMRDRTLTISVEK
ncbi:hypothetical protein [Dickeya sp. NCPPB 3274]|uniref:hypothetical protein n=1 Tax=Dickeya sp. NCPPB 3274 TaxID=568766 RepID=UPI0005B36D93|nr:hypothetical protein [Dickeya sp. NCPPB 3274]